MSDFADLSTARLKAILESDEELEVSEEAGAVDDLEVLYLLRELRLAWDDEWGSFEGSEVYERLVGSAKDEQLTRAVAHGHKPTLDRHVGSSSDGVDMADWNRYEMLKDLFRQSPEHTNLTNSIFQCVIFSSAVPPTGRGKTNTMYTLVEVAKAVHDDLRVVTNNTSDSFETTPEQWVDLERMIKEDDGWMFLGIDEAAQFLQFADQSSGKTISQRLKLLRHNKCHLVLIGHTGRDIPADIRRQVFVIDKLDQKTGSFGYGITSSGGDSMTVADEVFRLQNIPETGVEYDDIEDEGIEIRFDDDSESSAETSSEPEYSRCRGQSKDGSRCGTVSGLDSGGFCKHHGLDDVHPDAPEEPSS